MNFNHTEERQMLIDTLSRFIREKYRIEARNEAAVSSVGYQTKVWLMLAEMGIIGSLFSEEHGGFGGEGFDIAVVFEALGQGLVIEPFLDNAILAGGAIVEVGSGKQKGLLEAIIAGTTIAGFAHFEPDTHYELEKVSTSAQSSNGQWVLNGSKAVVKHAEAANFFVVSARTNGKQNDTTGISLFIIPTDTEGLTVQGYNTFDGGRAAELTLDNVTLEASALLGDEDAAYPVLEKVVGRGILALSAEAIGAMEVVKQSTVEYLQTRQQFGVPIGKFQALQHRMAELFIEIEQARSSVINAAAALDKDHITRERAVSAAKYTVGNVGRHVAEEAIQLHGGVGMAWELALGHYAKRLVLIDHELGDADHHLGRYITLGKQNQTLDSSTVKEK